LKSGSEISNKPLVRMGAHPGTTRFCEPAMKARSIILIAAACTLVLPTGCSKDAATAPTVSDQEKADLFAWAVESAFQRVAPDSETQTWSNTTVSGYESGTAVVNGTFTYDYDAMSGRKDETYDMVSIQFDDFCDDTYYPRLSGTLLVDGTCTTQYGFETTYYGQWELLGVDLQLSGKLKGTASIAMILRR